MTQRPLPRGQHGLPAEVVVVSQRNRIIEGTARAVAQHGYAHTTVAHIIALAGVSRTTFYQLFKDKEACFLWCFDALAEAHFHTVAAALAEPAPHPTRLLTALHGYMARVDADAGLARAFIGEAEGATPAIRSAYLSARQRLEHTLAQWLKDVRLAHPELPDTGPTTIELVNTAIGGLVVARARSGEPLLPLVPEMAALVFGAIGAWRWAEHARAMNATND